MTTPRLTIIIVSYKCLPLLTDCLDSIARSELSAAVQTIVIDNASDDGTAEQVRARYAGVHVIANTANVGFPAANNQGLALAASRSILLLNPDTVVQPGALGTLVAFLERDDQPKIVGLDVRNPDGSRQPCAYRAIPSAASFVVKQAGLNLIFGSDTGMDLDAVSTPQRAGWVTGAAIAFTRSVVDRIGVLDAQMFWAEDLDYCMRAQHAGIPVYALPGARILHYVGQSGKRNYRRMIRAQHESRIVFARRHYGTLPALALRAMFLALLPSKMALRAAQLVTPGRRAEHRDRLAGYWDALRFCLSP